MAIADGLTESGGMLCLDELYLGYNRISECAGCVVCVVCKGVYSHAYSRPAIPFTLAFSITLHPD